MQNGIKIFIFKVNNCTRYTVASLPQLTATITLMRKNLRGYFSNNNCCDNQPARESHITNLRLATMTE